MKREMVANGKKLEYLSHDFSFTKWKFLQSAIIIFKELFYDTTFESLRKSYW